MLDLRFIRENPQLIKEHLKRRFQEEKLFLVDEIIKNYEKENKLKKEIDELRHQRNSLSQEINKLKKEKKDASQKIQKAQALPQQISEREDELKKLHERTTIIQNKIPNLILKQVPLGKDASENVVRKKEGKIPKFTFQPKTHVELIEQLGLADFEASAKTSGNGFYFLKDKLALLNQALIHFTIDYMCKKKYTYIEPPLLLKRDVLSAATDTETLKNSIYSIEGEPLDLIGTSEYSLLGMHANEFIKEEDLPKKYFSYTMCFRKEIGSHGINEKGLWRTHQFNKIEQFIFCKPEDSEKYYDELLKNSEELIRKLKLPYRVLEMCSGDLALWKARSADIEVYRPTTKEYGEVCSLTNCTSYQARKLNIKLLRKDGTKEVLHTLNNTAIATSRILVAIIENYQQKDGSIKVPAVLQKYLGFKKIEKEK